MRYPYNEGWQCGRAEYQRGLPYSPGPHASRQFTVGYYDGWHDAQGVAQRAAAVACDEDEDEDQIAEIET